uniref:Leucine--trna mitochondrial n=1 Tax=Triatoma infestans TaxID=30076 RepID=A0A161MR01_TRIIF
MYCIKTRIFDLRVLLSMKFFRSLDISLVKFCTDIDFGKDLTTEIKQQIENKCKHVVNKSTFEENSKKNKFYVLSMFPYLSGNLHSGACQSIYD